jgi:predicted dehydrogenase
LARSKAAAGLKTVGIGIIGTGNISTTYLKAARVFPILKVRGVADINEEAARTRAREFGVEARAIADLLADPGIEIVVNLTVPAAHAQVSGEVIAAGKNVYSEKPLAVDVEEAARLLAAARRRGLRVGCAPDTFLGGAHQTVRKLIDEGRIGEPIAATAFFMGPGHENWHPNPAFFYKRGGGPMLDMGPYYVTALVDLLGPVKRVAGMTSRRRSERLITSEPLNGARVPVEVETHVTGTLEFHSGAIATLAMSFDVARHAHRPIEIYGAEGALSVPDPNWFGGQIEAASATSTDWQPVTTLHPYANGDFRMAGVADMAHAIRSGRPHRASGELAFHVLEVMTAFERSSKSSAFVTIESRPERPAMVPADIANGEFD